MGIWKQPLNIVPEVQNRNRNLPNIISNESMITTFANDRFSREPIALRIVIKAMIGNGSYGRVYKAQLRGSEETETVAVALKHSYFNAKTRQREVETMLQMEDHCNIVKLIMHSHVILGDPPKSSNILIMEYMPMNVLEYIKRYRTRTNQQPREFVIYVRILSYQMFRGLGYLHSLGICHRDIKPDNLLLDSQSMQLKLADFGNAKTLVPQGAHLSYVGSRLYRAPELLANYELYDCSIDIWSAGCVLAELLKGTPLFRSNRVELQQLDYIVSLLGTEGLDKAPVIHSLCAEMHHKPRPSWDLLLKVAVAQDLSDLLNSCLAYESASRILPMVACAHASFDELRIMDTLGFLMPNGKKLPPLFNFDDRELGSDERLRMDLLPLHLSEVESGVAANEVVQS